MLKLRYYQTDALKALHNYLSKENHGNPLIVMPTGSGKSLIIAKIISDFKQKHVLCLAHRTELIDQNYRELSALEPNLDISVYAAGLDRKELEHKAIISSVQSFYFIPEIDLPWIDKLIVDECHLIPKAENTQYLKVIRRLQKINPHLIIVGLSATPYRFDSGILIEGENKIFNDICYEISVSELVEKGFLAPLIVKARDRLDLSKIKKIAGDYSQKELEEKLGVEALVDKTVQDIIKNAGDKYNSWLIFAVGMKHLNLISASLEKYGISHRVIHAQLSNSQRAKNIALFKEKKIRAISVFPISQEEWIKINFFRKFKECYYIPPKGKGCWLAYSSKVRKRVPFKVYKSYQPRIINIEIISYVLKFGPINNDESVTSECGNKTCINPDHLKIINKKAKGTEHGLEEKTKKEIIDLYNEGYRVSHAIKKVLNLKGGDKIYISCYDCIHNIVNGKSGKHFALISKKEWRKKNMQIDSSTS